MCGRNKLKINSEKLIEKIFDKIICLLIGKNISPKKPD